MTTASTDTTLTLSNGTVGTANQDPPRPAPAERFQLVTGRVHLTAGDDRHRYHCTLIKAGENKNRWVLPIEVLSAAINKFSGAPCQIDHPGWFEAPSLQRLAGAFEQPVLEGEVVTAILRLNSTPSGELLASIFDAWLDDKSAGLEVPDIGLSAVLWLKFDYVDDKRVAREITQVESVDAVLHPAAGGRVERVLNSITPPGDHPPITAKKRSNTMPEELTDQGGAAVQTQQPPPEEEQDEQVTRPTPQPQPEPQSQPQMAELFERFDTLAGNVKRLTEIMAQQEEGRTIQGMGQAPRGDGRVTMTTGYEQIQAAWDWVFGAPGAKLPEPDARRTDWLYRKLSGDISWDGRFHLDRAREFLANANATTLADMVVNAMNKVIVPLYDGLQHYRWFERIVSVQPTDGSLQDMAWLQFGGIGNLPVVADGGAYTELTVADSKESDSFVKYGGYVGITEKALRNSDIARMQAIPRQLTVSAIRTRSAKIAAIFSTASGLGPTLDQDSVALFDATSHGNYATTAFSWNAWKAARAECAKQTELGSSKRQGLFPRYGLFPIDLYDDALIAFGYGQGTGGRPAIADNDVNPYAESRPGDPRAEAIMVPDWTDTNNWYYIVDPLIAPVIQMAYADSPGGGTHPAPTLYVVTSPLAGLMFTNDTLPVKVKDHYAYGVATWRGIGGRVV